MTGGLWVKDDSANPTHSFKDRVVAGRATAAKQLGFTKIACASTGNLANSVAAHAARAGLPSFVFIPTDLEPGKVVQSAVYGGTLVAVDGSYDDVNRLTSELAETDEFEDDRVRQPNVRPYYAEGSKTIGYEVAEQLGWRHPGAGGHPDGVRLAADQGGQGVPRARRRRARRGHRVDDLRRAVGRAATRSSTAFDDGRDVVEPVKPTGIAKSLNIGNPADGPYALDAIRRTGGAVGRVGDDEIVAGHPRCSPGPPGSSPRPPAG